MGDETQTTSPPEHVNGQASPVTPSADSVDANYQYWRDHGEDWIEGYERRKKRQVLYHIQELMLTHYVLQHAATALAKPLKVLEFGCGVGRHLRNLSRLPDVDVYGFDQSAAMVQGVYRWLGKEWADAHVKVGLPTGKLPFPDKHFDIVYSTEVLVHVRPEHIEGILSELVRVCRGHILHIEAGEHVPICSGAHDGCWKHDLVASYARLGLSCEILPSGYQAHTPFRVKVGEEPRFTWAPTIIDMYRRLERDINEGFSWVEDTAGRQADKSASDTRALVSTHAAQMQAAQAQIAGLNESLAAQAVKIEAMAQEHAARAAQLDAELAALKAAMAQAQTEHAAAMGAVKSELEHKAQALTSAGAAFQARIADLEAQRAGEHANAAALLNQRQAFVTAVSKYLRDGRQAPVS